jgi:hypothetical protein
VTQKGGLLVVLLVVAAFFLMKESQKIPSQSGGAVLNNLASISSHADGLHSPDSLHSFRQLDGTSEHMYPYRMNRQGNWTEIQFQWPP